MDIVTVIWLSQKLAFPSLTVGTLMGTSNTTFLSVAVAITLTLEVRSLLVKEKLAYVVLSNLLVSQSLSYVSPTEPGLKQML